MARHLLVKLAKSSSWKISRKAGLVRPMTRGWIPQALIRVTAMNLTIIRLEARSEERKV